MKGDILTRKQCKSALILTNLKLLSIVLLGNNILLKTEILDPVNFYLINVLAESEIYSNLCF